MSRDRADYKQEILGLFSSVLETLFKNTENTQQELDALKQCLTGSCGQQDYALINRAFKNPADLLLRNLDPELTLLDIRLWLLAFLDEELVRLTQEKEIDLAKNGWNATAHKEAITKHVYEKNNMLKAAGATIVERSSLAQQYDDAVVEDFRNNLLSKGQYYHPANLSSDYQPCKGDLFFIYIQGKWKNVVLYNVENYVIQLKVQDLKSGEDWGSTYHLDLNGSQQAVKQTPPTAEWLSAITHYDDKTVEDFCNREDVLKNPLFPQWRGAAREKFYQLFHHDPKRIFHKVMLSWFQGRIRMFPWLYPRAYSLLRSNWFDFQPTSFQWEDSVINQTVIASFMCMQFIEYLFLGDAQSTPKENIFNDSGFRDKALLPSMQAFFFMLRADYLCFYSPVSRLVAEESLNTVEEFARKSSLPSTLAFQNRYIQELKILGVGSREYNGPLIVAYLVYSLEKIGYSWVIEQKLFQTIDRIIELVYLRAFTSYLNHFSKKDTLYLLESEARLFGVAIAYLHAVVKDKKNKSEKIEPFTEELDAFVTLILHQLRIVDSKDITSLIMKILWDAFLKVDPDCCPEQLAILLKKIVSNTKDINSEVYNELYPKLEHTPIFSRLENIQSPQPLSATSSATKDNRLSDQVSTGDNPSSSTDPTASAAVSDGTGTDPSAVVSTSTGEQPAIAESPTSPPPSSSLPVRVTTPTTDQAEDNRASSTAHTSTKASP